MSLFKSQLFTEESRALRLDLDQPSDSFGRTYGNHIANARKFREPWGCSCREPPSKAVEAT